ncbi:hypothetical protein PI124_g6660 [Phytophthora idaei]|nr:hypothetical protein PI125_g7970 [Phytophthora idaei]KAG3248669.1 hypothetical protein PI124_g6660 [Phytophthora idaei]
MKLLPGLREAFPERAKRGRPPSSLSANFFRLKEKCNKTMWWTVCKYCYAEYVNDKENVPFPIAVHGRKEAWEKHLEACERYARVTRVRRIADNCGSVCENGDASKKHCVPPPGFTSTEIKTFWCLLLEYQAEALLPASFVELRSFKRLLTFLNPRCAATGAVPRRQVLGGQVLNEYSNLHSIEQRDDVTAMQQRTGGRINMLSDVWENVAKNMNWVAKSLVSVT